MTMEHKLSKDKVKNFILGGNSIFTVMNTQTQNRMCFKVVVCKPNPKFKFVKNYFVKVQKGSSNESFDFIGTIIKGQEFRHSPNAKYPINDISVISFNWIWKNINNLPDNFEVYHVGKCGRCGRALTVPESIETGFGPECSGKVDVESKNVANYSGVSTVVPTTYKKKRQLSPKQWAYLKRKRNGTYTKPSYNPPKPVEHITTVNNDPFGVDNTIVEQNKTLKDYLNEGVSVLYVKDEITFKISDIKDNKTFSNDLNSGKIYIDTERFIAHNKQKIVDNKTNDVLYWYFDGGFVKLKILNA